LQRISELEAELEKQGSRQQQQQRQQQRHTLVDSPTLEASPALKASPVLDASSPSQLSSKELSKELSASSSVDNGKSRVEGSEESEGVRLIRTIRRERLVDVDLDDAAVPVEIRAGARALQSSLAAAALRLALGGCSRSVIECDRTVVAVDGKRRGRVRKLVRKL
jgi:hypothetical protein